MPISETYNLDNLGGLRAAPKRFYDLAICDVPYGKDEANKVLSRVRPVIQKNGSRTPMKAKHQPKDWDKEQPPQEFFDEVFRVAKRHIIFGANYLQFNQKGNSTGRIFWDKVNGGSDFSDGELLWTNLFKGIRKFTYMWNGFCQGISLNEPTRQRGNKKLNEKRIHPSQKPRALYQWIFENFTKPNFKILDTHLGSGASRIVAYDFGLAFYGYEKDADYFADAEREFGFHQQKRLSQPALFTPETIKTEQVKLF